jgi:hypothetical protein
MTEAESRARLEGSLPIEETMPPSHRVVVNVPASRRIEIDLPRTLPEGPAEVVVVSQQPVAQFNRGAGMDAGNVWISEDFDAPMN